MWVVSRKLCRCTGVALPALTARQRASALALHLRQASPFARTGAYAVVGHGQAALWYWDRARVEAAARELGVDPARLWVVPESVLWAPLESGLRLVRCREGVEAQWWSAGNLMSSRWWPQMPDAGEWAMFVRQLGAAGSGLSGAVPAPVPVEPLAVPWAANALDDTAAGSALAVERLLYGAGASALLLWASWLGGTWVKLESEAGRLAAELQRSRTAATPVMRAREAALEDLRYLQTFADIAAYPDPRVVLAALARALPDDGTTVGDFDLRDGSLRVQVLAANVNPPIAALVQSLKDSGLVANAKANTELGGRTVIVTADVRRADPGR